MKKLSKEEFELFKGTNLNLKSENERQEYMKMYLLYRQLLTEYLIKILNLKEYDNKLIQSDLKFSSTSQKDMDIYQYVCSDFMKYFYIRNDLNIKVLSKEEIQFLKEKISLGDFNLDEKTSEFIGKTYAKVIFKDVLNNGEIYNVSYGPNAFRFFAPNNAIVIGFRYDEFENNGMNDEQWAELNDKQRNYLSKLLEILKQESEGKLNIPISIIEYDDSSVESMTVKNVEDEKEER